MTCLMISGLMIKDFDVRSISADVSEEELNKEGTDNKYKDHKTRDTNKTGNRQQKDSRTTTVSPSLPSLTS